MRQNYGSALGINSTYQQEEFEHTISFQFFLGTERLNFLYHPTFFIFHTLNEMKFRLSFVIHNFFYRFIPFRFRILFFASFFFGAASAAPCLTFRYVCVPHNNILLRSLQSNAQSAMNIMNRRLPSESERKCLMS